jgi:hypothetical protein
MLWACIMKIEQKKWTPTTNWQSISTSLKGQTVTLVFAFGDRFLLNDEKRFAELRQLYPKAHIVLASTSGNILGTNLDDQSIVTTAIAFEHSSSVEIKRINIKDVKSSFKAGEEVGQGLTQHNLQHVFLLSDGHIVNGSELLKGILSVLPQSIAVTGGLAGDGTRFEKTVVGVDAAPQEGEIVVIGFYGTHLKFGIGSFGGWDPFGIERKITRSSGNILFELDGKSALDLYKKYLGDQVKELPGSAMLFPLAIRPDEHAIPIVRTILSINEKDKSMIFAGDIPEGWYAQLMKANFDRLVEGAFHAANFSHEMLENQSPDLALLISCVGRRLVLDQRTEEELDSVQEVFGNDTVILGFYSYGEIAPKMRRIGCELHNQTMTITTIVER